MPIQLLKPSTGPLGDTYADHAARRPNYPFKGQDIGRRREFDTDTQDRRIVASHDGEAWVTEGDPNYGNYIDLHASADLCRRWGVREAFTRYAHFALIVPGNGARLLARGHLGVMGASGNALGIHLHQEFHVDGIQVDPALYYVDSLSDFTGITEPLEPEDPMREMIRMINDPQPGQGQPHVLFHTDGYFESIDEQQSTAYQEDGTPFREVSSGHMALFQRHGLEQQARARAAAGATSGAANANEIAEAVNAMLTDDFTQLATITAGLPAAMLASLGLKRA